MHSLTLSPISILAPLIMALVYKFIKFKTEADEKFFNKQEKNAVVSWFYSQISEEVQRD